MDEFVIARNPDEHSSLPYLLRIPLPSGAVVLKAKDTWPRTNKIYCDRADEWPSPDEVDIVDDVSESESGPGRVAAIVVEDRYPAVFELRHVRPSSIATQLAEAAVRYSSVPNVLAETRQLAQEWSFRLFGAAVEHALNERVGVERTAQLAPAGSVPHRAPTPAGVVSGRLGRGSV